MKAASPLSLVSLLLLALSSLVDCGVVGLVLGVPDTGERSAPQLVGDGYPALAQQFFRQADFVTDNANAKEGYAAVDEEDSEEEEARFDEVVVHPLYAPYKLRLRKPPKNLCDPSVKQYSGYLDISNDKHLFFWFFEARVSPSTAPVLLWLNGGPGCSSSTGLFIELGPCTLISDDDDDDGVEGEGNRTVKTVLNPYGWNAHANIIFLDQPVEVGYSYSDKSKGESGRVSDSTMAGKDVYAFLQLFFARFGEYAKAPFHIAAESYGTIYATHFAKAIFERNQELQRRPSPSPSKSNNSPTLINLVSVILANGITDPLVQYPSIADYVCEGPYSDVFGGTDSPECGYVKSKAPVCQRLIEGCYKSDLEAESIMETKTETEKEKKKKKKVEMKRKRCVRAQEYCSTEIEGPLFETGVNPYDVRRNCNAEENGETCYKEMAWVEQWLNVPEHKRALGVQSNRTFTACDVGVFEAFARSGEGVMNTASLLPELVDAGVRLLVYAGDADPICNVIGNERWLERLRTTFQDEFLAATRKTWSLTTEAPSFDLHLHHHSERANAGRRVAGVVRSAGGGGLTAGNVTFVIVYNAGHLVPYDQPEAALDLISRWLKDVPLTTTTT